MPVHTGKDSKGNYAQWGDSGAKYYYKDGDEASKKDAMDKAAKQGAAAHANGFKGREMKVNGAGMYEPDQLRQIPVAVVAREAGSEGEAIRAEFVISNYSLDSYGTRFDPEGLNIDQYRRNPIVTYRHMRDGGMFALPIGRGLVDTIRKDKDGSIRMTVEFTPEDVFPFGHQVGKMVRAGYVNMGSIGADPLREEVIKEPDGRQSLVFREWMLYEFAIVPIGSNDDALCTKRITDLKLDREELAVRERELEASVKPEDEEEARLKEIVELLREGDMKDGKDMKKKKKDMPEEDMMDGHKVMAECYSTDEGTYVNMKIRREKDGKETELIIRDVLFVPKGEDGVKAIVETSEQFKHRDYFEKHAPTVKEYREFLDRMYKAFGVKKPDSEIEAVRGMDTLLDLALTAPVRTRQAPPKKAQLAISREKLRTSVTQLVKDVVIRSRAALLNGEPVSSLDEIIEREAGKAISSISFPTS